MKGIRKMPMLDFPPREHIVHERAKIFDNGVDIPTVYLKKYPPINMGPIILHERYNLHPLYTDEEREVYSHWKAIIKTVPISCSKCNRALGVIEIPYDVRVDLRLECPICNSKIGYRYDPEQVKLKGRKTENEK